MILDSLSHIDTYKNLGEKINRGLKLLTTDFTGVPDGRYEVDDDIFYMIQTYDTKPDNDLPEAHRKYIDIQCVISGAETIGIGKIENMTEVEAHPDRDLWLYHGPMDYVTLTPGRFVVVWPQDPHAASIKAGDETGCHKVVVKVRTDD